jgi:hypothetical protein
MFTRVPTEQGMSLPFTDPIVVPDYDAIRSYNDKLLKMRKNAEEACTYNAKTYKAVLDYATSVTSHESTPTDPADTKPSAPLPKQTEEPVTGDCMPDGFDGQPEKLQPYIATQAARQFAQTIIDHRRLRLLELFEYLNNETRYVLREMRNAFDEIMNQARVAGKEYDDNRRGERLSNEIDPNVAQEWYDQNGTVLLERDVFNQKLFHTSPLYKSSSRLLRAGATSNMRSYGFSNRTYGVRSRVSANYTRPVAAGDYESAYDGDTLVKIERADTKDRDGYDMYEVETPNAFVLVNGSVRHFCALKKLHNIDPTMCVNHIALMTLVDGVPGCGKTEEILNRAEPGDLILTITRENRKNIQERLIAKEKTDIMTITLDSYLINYAGRMQYKRVFFDEGLMEHAGYFDIVCYYTQCIQLLVFGDTHQIPFIPRQGHPTIRHIMHEWHDVEYRSVSYRCPLDVTAVFRGVWPQGFITTSKVAQSITTHPINGAEDIRLEHQDAKVITMTQNEKMILIKRFPNCNTIHEVEGQTHAHVAMVRLHTKQLKLYDEIDENSHFNVMLTRHTHTFQYFHVTTDDKFSNELRNKRSCKPPTEKDLPALPSFATGVTHETRRALTAHRAVMAYVYQEPRKYTQTVLPNDPRCVKVLDLTQGVPTDAVKLSYGVPHYLTRLSLGPDYNHIHRSEYKSSVNDVIKTIQACVDHYAPTASTEFTDCDAIQIEYNDLDVAVSNMRINLAKLDIDVLRTCKVPTVMSRIRTGWPITSYGTMRQILSCIAQRNCSAQRQMVPQDVGDEAQNMLNSFYAKHAVPNYRDILNSYRANPVVLDEEAVARWVSETDNDKIRRINDQVDHVDIKKFLTYLLDIKGVPKPKLEGPAIVGTVPVSQGIIHQDPEASLFYCIMVKELTDRFIALLSPSTYAGMRKRPDELGHWLTQHVPVESQYHAIEVDFSKFDKSQHRTALFLETLLMQDLGLPADWAALWYRMHTQSVCCGLRHGIKFYCMFQRRSGDAMTMLGNTFINMAALAHSIPQKGFVCGAYSGDDSFEYYLTQPDVSMANTILVNAFNLNAKIIQRPVVYFCSQFLVRTPDGWVVCPDAWKVMLRLGRHLELDTVDIDADLEERLISLRDTIRPLTNMTVRRLMQLCILDRYGDNPCVGSALAAVAEMYFFSLKDFKKLFHIYKSPLFARKGRKQLHSALAEIKRREGRTPKPERIRKRNFYSSTSSF